MKTPRFNSLLASTALALVLVLGSHAGMAQQSDQQISAGGVPMPDTSLPPPLTAKDVQGTPDTAKTEPKRDMPPVVDSATAPVPAPAAMPASVAADTAVADQLREMIGGKLDRIVSRKADREGIEAFYKARDFKPLWVADGAASDRAQKAIAYLGQVDTVGLDPNEYPAPDFKASTPEALAQAELKLTASVLTYARHAQIGLIHYSRVGGDIQFNLQAPEPAKVLEKLVDAKDAGQALDSFNPPQAQFKALKAKLAEIRNNGGAIAQPEEKEKQAHVNVQVPEGKILREGMKDQRVIALRKRLQVKGEKDNPLYDDAVRDAVKTFQTEADLNVDGNLGPNTVRALNGEKAKRIPHGPSANPVDTILVNMERWRWLPRDLGNPHVIVNVPDYTLTLYSNDKPYWHTKIVAGKPSLATPMVSAEMKFITVNPTWNVPPSIIEKEYLPALEQDPQALERIGLRVEQNPDGTLRVYQPPGAGNALGRIRFNFPNKFLVYQHDTPDKYLFARDERAFSHGCMRVQNPLTYGEKLLSLVLPNEHYTEARLEKMFGGGEININFPKFIWVHLTYQTAFVDAAGKLQLRKDVYGRDAKMIAILKGSERKVADIAIERKPDTSSKPVKMPVGMYGGNSYSYSGGGGFFGFLFGGGPRYSQPVYRPPSRVGNNARYQYR